MAGRFAPLVHTFHRRAPAAQCGCSSTAGQRAASCLPAYVPCGTRCHVLALAPASQPPTWPHPLTLLPILPPPPSACLPPPCSYLDGNAFTGGLPNAWGTGAPTSGMPSLRFLQASNNPLGGTLPSERGGLEGVGVGPMQLASRMRAGRRTSAHAASPSVHMLPRRRCCCCCLPECQRVPLQTLPTPCPRHAPHAPLSRRLGTERLFPRAAHAVSAVCGGGDGQGGCDTQGGALCAGA